jgi:hypothetical protein
MLEEEKAEEEWLRTHRWAWFVNGREKENPTAEEMAQDRTVGRWIKR